MKPFCAKTLSDNNSFHEIFDNDQIDHRFICSLTSAHFDNQTRTMNENGFHWTGNIPVDSV